MIDIRHLINYLPFYFKDKDTYKVDNKGILERFLEICGDYFTDNIKSVIDNQLDILDLEKTSQSYLVWLWELLGQIPFANNKPGSSPLVLSSKQQRDLIKYCNELLKIRGTEEFFEVMFRVYSNSTNNLKLVSIEYEGFGWDQDPEDSREYIKSRTGTSEVKGYQKDKNVLWPYFDHDIFDDNTIRFDEYYRMKQCIDVTFNITGTFSNVESANKTIQAFIRRYVPYNVNPIIKINGQELSEKYSLVLEIYKDNKWVVPEGVQILGNNSNLPVRVYVVNSKGDTVEGMKFTSSLNGGTQINRTSIYTFNISNVIENIDNYLFELDDDSLTLQVSLEAEQEVSYHISITPESVQLSASVKEAKCTVEAYSSKGGNKIGALVLCQETGEVKDPGDGLTTNWTFTKTGEYTFILVGHTSSQVKFKVNNWERSYTVKLAKATLENNKWVPGAYTDKLILNGKSTNNTRYFIKVESDDPEVDPNKLTCYMVGSPANIYNTGALLIAQGFDTYIFKPTNPGPNNKSATLSVISDNYNFNTSIIDRFVVDGIGDTIDEINNDVSKVAAVIKSIPNNSTSEIKASQGLEYMVELPNGDIIDIPKGTTKTGDGYKIISKEGDTYLGKPSYNVIEIQSTQGGVYKAWLKVSPYNQVTWEVLYKVVEFEIPEGIMIIANTDKNWTGNRTDNATYQLTEDAREAVFKLALYRTAGGNRIIMNTGASIEGSNGNYYDLDTFYTETEVQDLVFTCEYDSFKDGSKSKTATLHIKDFVTTIELRCKPSISLLVNEQATTKLSISCNKPELKLSIEYIETGDIYEDGDTFTANETGEYVFRALVDGKPFKDENGKEVTCTFKVGEKDSLDVTPDTIEFNADGTPVGNNTININTSNDSTEWILIQQ